MAKRGLSDALSVSLIRGAGDIGKAKNIQRRRNKQQALESIKGLSDYAVGLAEKKESDKLKRNAKLEKHVEELGGIPNARLLKSEQGQQMVKEFLRNGRDKYNEANKMWEKTKDAQYKDQMDAIKRSFVNANEQILAFDADKQKYLTASKNDELVTLEGDEIYEDIYSGNTTLSFDEDGALSFSVKTESAMPQDVAEKYRQPTPLKPSGDFTVAEPTQLESLTPERGHSTTGSFQLKDIAGKYGQKVFAGETAVLQNNDLAIELGQSGGEWQGDSIKNKYMSVYKKLNDRDLAAMFKTDITGDDSYKLQDGSMSADQSLEAMWLSGNMDQKFYKDFKPEDGINWIYDPQNKNKVAGLISEYYTDVNKFEYDRNFVAKPEDPWWKKLGFSNIGQARKAGYKKGVSIEETGNFAHINKGQYIPLAGVSVHKGSLENIRTDIKNRKPFYLGPKDDEKAFVPVGESGWEMQDSDGKTLQEYNSLSEFLKSGLKTSDKGFRSLIQADYTGDDRPDQAPFRLNIETDGGSGGNVR